MRNIFTGLTILILLIPAIPRAEDRGYPDRLPLPYEWDYVNRDGYQYAYKMTLDKMAPDPMDRFTNAIGTLEIRGPGTNELVYKETGLYADGCPGTDFARPQALKMGLKQSGFVVICDTDEGHFSTLRIFDNYALVAKLDYVIVDPNLAWYPEYQSYLAVIDYRENIGEGTDYLEMVYEWIPYGNENSEFHPIFNSHSYKLYLEEYEAYKRQKPVQYLPLLAELIATSKSSLICSELGKSPLKKLSRSQLKEYMAIIEKPGFPSFDLSICKGSSRK
ncbi:MAG: hypothetical protein ACYC0M_14035 [Burkholderiales bacterium]